MGGGITYSVGPSIKDIDRLEDIAREEISKRGDLKPRKKIFISFKHEDKQLVDSFRAQAKNENSELDFIDMSLKVPFNSENAEYIRKGIRARIEQCSVTVVMVTDKTHESDWVNWEIRESIKLNKSVVIIDKTDGKGPLPKAVKENRDKIKIVPWKHRDIMDALDK